MFSPRSILYAATDSGPAAKALGAIGPDAKAAIPALKEARKDSLMEEAATDAILLIDPEAFKTGK